MDSVSASEDISAEETDSVPVSAAVPFYAHPLNKAAPSSRDGIMSLVIFILIFLLIREVLGGKRQ